MTHDWYFHALNERIDLEKQGESLISFLQSTITIAHYTIHANDNVEGNEYVRSYLEIEPEDLLSQSRIELIEKEGSKMPTVLAFMGDVSIRDLILAWLKAEIGIILFPIQFNSSLMIDATDALLYAIRVHSSEVNRVKLLFDVDTHNKNLRRIEIDLNKDTMKTFSMTEERSVFKEAIIPYIFEETGIIIPKLSLIMVSMMGIAKITKEGVSTFSNTLESELLTTILKRSQFD